VPELYAGFSVKRIDVAERRRHKHDSIDNDGRSLQRFLDVRLEDPRDVQVLYVVAPDLSGGMKARLGIISVCQKKIIDVLVCRVELLLSDRRNHCLARGRLGFLFRLLRADGSYQETSNPRQNGG
jgi:hypothetical protein